MLISVILYTIKPMDDRPFFMRQPKWQIVIVILVGFLLYLFLINKLGGVEKNFWPTTIDLIIFFPGFLAFIFFFAQFVAPVQKIKEERIEVFVRLWRYLVGDHGPAVLIENGSAKSREREMNKKGAGILILDTASAALLRNDVSFTRAVGPGVVFTHHDRNTGQSEYSAGSLDLRRQSEYYGPREEEDPFSDQKKDEKGRIVEKDPDYQERQKRRMLTSGLTRDGIEVVPNVFVSFGLDTVEENPPPAVRKTQSARSGSADTLRSDTLEQLRGDLHEFNRSLGEIIPFLKTGAPIDEDESGNLPYEPVPLNPKGQPAAAQDSGRGKLKKIEDVRRDRTEFDFSEPSARRAIGYEAVDPTSKDNNDRYRVEWKKLPGLLAIDVWREVIHMFTVEQLFSELGAGWTLPGALPGKPLTGIEFITRYLSLRLTSQTVPSLGLDGKPGGPMTSREFQILKGRGVSVKMVTLINPRLPSDFEEKIIQRWINIYLPKAQAERLELDNDQANVRSSAKKQAIIDYAQAVSRHASQLAPGVRYDTNPILIKLLKDTLAFLNRPGLNSVTDQEKIAAINIINWLNEHSESHD